MELDGQVAIVTGGAKLRSIGHAAARGLAREGAHVVIADIDDRDFDEARQSVESFGTRCLCVRTDVRDQAAVQAMVNHTGEQFGRIDILVNAAGGSWAITPHDVDPPHQRRQYQGLTDSSLDDWRTILGVNLDGPFFAAQAVAPYFMKQRGGRIVNFSSTAARIGVKPGTEGGSGPYAVAKAGIIGLTKQLAQELAAYGVTANCVAPGFIDNWRTKAQELPPDQLRNVSNLAALRRLGTVDEVAELVVALCTSEMSYVTGVTLDVNGAMYNA